MVTNKKPTTYVFELTGRCNQHCSFCYSISYDPLTQKPRKDSLTGQKWISALENIVKCNAKAVDFSGGEPTLHPEFKNILSSAKKLGLYTIVSTNGSTFDQRDIVDCIDEYANCISLSIHGTKKVHNLLKGKGESYNQATASFGHYLSGEKLVKVNSVACKQNKENLYLLGERLGVDCNPFIWKISQVIPRESGLRTRELISINKDEFEEIQKDLIQRFPYAYKENRLIFREDDSDTAILGSSPYIIASSDGSLYVPEGKNHKNLDISILDHHLSEKLLKRLKDCDGFISKLNLNHNKSYTGPEEQIQMLKHLQKTYRLMRYL